MFSNLGSLKMLALGKKLCNIKTQKIIKSIRIVLQSIMLRRCSH